jgi:hypothetical protein
MNIRTLMIAAFLCVRTALADISGIITTSVEVSPGYTQYGNAYWYSASAPYVNGGVTFTFPTNLFLQTPTVVASVSIGSSGSYSASTTVSCIVTSISTTSVTVRVNTGTLSSIIEAATNDFTVHVWAVGTED